MEVKQLIDKYLANKTSKEEERQLRQLLLAVPKGERSKQDEALLLMLAPMHSEPIGDVFDVDYSEEYHTIVRRRKMLRLRYAVLATLAVAASVVLIVLFNWNRDVTSIEQPKQTETIVQQVPTEKEMTKKTIKKTLPLPPSYRAESSHHKPATSSSYYSPPSQEGAKGPVDPHYAWARSLIDNYHEDEEVSKSVAMEDNKPSQSIPVIDINEEWQKRLEQEWAANDIQTNIATIKSKGKRLQRKIEELKN